MPSLDWIGKKAVVDHHKQVPFHLLKCNDELSVGDPGSGNLLVQGDNLLALKALLPYYAGQVKCIYIDPPYNTGNEGWVYNDNVNSPEMKAWLGKTVGKEVEDLSRHDKWLCMMYPRLALLRDFLRDDGIIFVSLDDTESALCRLLLDEIFGITNFLAIIAWEKRYTRSNNAKLFYSVKDTILVYRKSPAVSFLREARTEKSDSIYKNPDNDPRGSWTSASYVNPATKEKRPNLVYPIINPNNNLEINHPTHAWKFEYAEHLRHVEDNRIWWGKKGNAKYPRLKVFPKTENAGLVPVDIWKHEDSGTTDEGGAELKAIFGSAVFDNPKPTKLIDRVLKLATKPGDLILDSFAGSGTTGHAVMKLNNSLPGEEKRRFILAEIDSEIAQEITSARLTKTISGYTDPLGKEVSPLGGGFRFCELGDTLFNANGQVGETVMFKDLAHHVFFMATGEPLPKGADLNTPRLGVSNGVAVYLLYNGILGDKSVNGGNVLTRDILASFPPHDGTRIIYGNGCRIGAERLRRENIIFRQVPYEVRVS